MSQPSREPTYGIRCAVCSGYHGDSFSQGDAWDEATAHERATGHTTYVVLNRPPKEGA